MTELTKTRIRNFVSERDWSQYHNPKDLAIALSIEASELLENFLWKSPEEASVEKIRQELADIFIYCNMLADKYGFDIDEIVNEKISLNEQKYPVEKAKGKATKWDKL